jgi:alanine dehydrogenase
MVIGGGVVGYQAARVAVGMGAETYILDRNIDRLRELDTAFAGACTTLFATNLAVEELLPSVDLVVGAVLVRGAKAPHVLTRDHLGLMRPGAVLVDVSIDQGGCFETSRPTTHSDPTYEIDGISHYCVANMPGAVPVTSTMALTNATLPYIVCLAGEGVQGALLSDPGFLDGLNVAGGHINYEPVARDQGRPWVDATEALTELAVPA